MKRGRKRDYLYGRLLALADRIEYRTFDKENGRETNAKRYMNAFSPASLSNLEGTGRKIRCLLETAKYFGKTALSKCDG